MMMRFKFLFFLLVFLTVGLLANSVLAAPVKNSLLRKDLIKYGVNPWSVDTDYDIYFDDWEVLNDYCPTNPAPIHLKDPACEKGKINWNKGIYTPPTAVAAVAPMGVKFFSSCADLEKTMQEARTNKEETKKISLTSNDGIKELTGHAGATTSSLNFALDMVGYTLLGTGEANDFYSSGVRWQKEGDYNYIDDGGSYINIIKTDKTGATRLLSKIQILGTELNEASGSRFFVSGNRLVVVGKRLVESKTDSPRFPTTVAIWDIKDKTRPALLKRYEFNGTARALNLSGGYLRLALDNYFKLSPTSTITSKNFLPEYLEVKGKVTARKSLACTGLGYIDKNFLIFDDRYRYLQLAVIPLDGVGAVASQAVFGNSHQVLFRGDRAYVFDLKLNDWSSVLDLQNVFTEIYQFNFNKNKINLVNGHIFPGVVIADNSVLARDNRLFIVSRQLNSANRIQSDLVIFDDQSYKIAWYGDFSENTKSVGMRFAGKTLLLRSQEDYINSNPLVRYLTSFFSALMPVGGANNYDAPLREHAFDLTNPRAPKYLGLIRYPEFVHGILPLSNSYALGFAGRGFLATTTVGLDANEGLRLSFLQTSDPLSPLSLFTKSFTPSTTYSGAVHQGDLMTARVGKNDFLVLPVSAMSSDKKTSNQLLVYKISIQHGFEFVGGIDLGGYGFSNRALTKISGDNIILYEKDMDMEYKNGRYEQWEKVRTAVFRLSDASLVNTNEFLTKLIK